MHLQSLQPSQVRKSALLRSTSALAENTVSLLCKQSARDGRVKNAAHCRENSFLKILVPTQTIRKAPRQRQKILFCRPYAISRRTPSRRLTTILLALLKFLLSKILLHIAPLRVFNCGKSGYIASACSGAKNFARKCFGCGGVGHIARNCPTRSAQATAQTNASSFSNSVTFSGKRATQAFRLAVIGGVRIADAPFDTGSAYSMVNTAIDGGIQNAPLIQPFTGSVLDVIGVGITSAEICGYVDAPVEMDYTAVRHPLLVVESLAFPLFMITDILRPHGGIVTLDESAPLRLRMRCFANSPLIYAPNCPMRFSLRAQQARLSSNPARLHSFAF